MEGVRRSGRPGQEHSGASSRKSESISSKESLSLGDKGDQCHRSERRSQKVTEMGKGSHSKAATTRPSQGPRGSRPHGWGSPDGRLSRRHKENRPPEETVRGRPPPSPGGRTDTSASPRAGPQDGRDLAPRPPQLHGRRTRPRSPARTPGQGRCQEDPGGRPASPKRPRHCPPRSPRRRSRSPCAGARGPLAALVPRLGTQVGALQEALDALRAPGGAFLPGPPRGPQPEAREPGAGPRAWLSWQLAHAGAALHWALRALDPLLAAPPGTPVPQPCAPQPSWPAAVPPEPLPPSRDPLLPQRHWDPRKPP